MRSYEKIEDFLEDKSFRRWVLDGDSVHKAHWLEWLEAHPSHVELVEHAKIILLELTSSGGTWDTERQQKRLLKILDKIDPANVETVITKYPVYISYTSTIEIRVKTAILVLLSVVLITAVLQGLLSSKTEEVIVVEDRQEGWIIKTNPKGQKSIVQLADGSNVVLNAESEIRYPSDFGQGHRDIYLKGEAFFEVASDSLLPFKVYSGKLVATVLGTSFNINSFDNDKVRVQLATGKLRVFNEADEEQSVYLAPGEEVTMDQDHKLNKSKFDLKKAFHWKNGILLFEQKTFEEVVVVLERWYAVEVTLKNPAPKDLRISGEFKNTHLKDVLESLGYAYGFTYSIKNKEVSIHFKPQE
jgi:transmembrane sensor